MSTPSREDLVFLEKTDMFKTSSELVCFGAHIPFAVSGLGSGFMSVLHHHTVCIDA